MRNGCACVGKGHFGLGFQPDCRRAIIPKEDVEITAFLGNQEPSPLSRSITYEQKKLVFSKWHMLLF